MRVPDSELPRGIYRHYKGQYYALVDYAHHSETMELLVVYRALYGAFDLWVRPAAMFHESVMWEGEERPRFAWVGTSLTDIA
jgi:hypothetical protein